MSWFNLRRCAAMAALLLVSQAATSRAQDPAPTPRAKHLPSRVFSIPIDIDWNARTGIKQTKLYISSNSGTTWDLHATNAAGQTKFDVRVERDGTYAFAIQTLFNDGTSVPAGIDQLRPSQYAVVDTERPSVILRPLPVRPAPEAGKITVGVQWDVRDENLDPRSIRLEVRWAGQGMWTPITDKTIGAQGEDIRTIAASNRMEVRLSARDLAGNDAYQVVMLGANGSVVSGVTGDTAGGPVSNISGLPRPKFILVNQRDIAIDFVVREKGPSGIASYDVWVTQNRRDWKKELTPAIKTVEGTDKATLTYQAEKDGMYGFTIIARSRANIAQAEPRSGDEPQVWVEVDTLKPEGKIQDVRFTHPNDLRSITITWTASDKNLDVAPVLFDYRVGTEEWKPMTPLVANTGRQTFNTPELKTNEYQFQLRMRIVDRAGNITAVEYEKPIVVDIIKPQVEITDAAPAKKP